LERLGLPGSSSLTPLLLRATAGAPGRGGTWIVSLPKRPERLLFRRLRHGGLLGNRLGAHFLGPQRALEELGVTASLALAGAPVPRPALVWGRREVGPLWQLFVATVYEEGAHSAMRFLQGVPDPTRVCVAAAALGRSVRRFHDAGGSHADLHAGNLLLVEEAEELRGLVVDLDRAKQGPLEPAQRMHQLMRLYRSLRKHGVLDQVRPRGCAAFFGAYCGGDRKLRHALIARLDRELRCVALHALHYRRG